MKQPDLGRKISDLRLSLGLTQKELADKCNFSLRTIQRIEAAEVNPRSFTVKKVFSELNYQDNNLFRIHGKKYRKIAYQLKLWYPYLIHYFNLKTNTMRKLTLLSAILFAVVLSLTFFPGKLRAQQNLNKTYYSLTNVDASILEKDSIVFYKTQKSKEAARLEFYQDSDFCLFYNMKTDTLSNVNKETGFYTQEIVENRDKIEGKYVMLVETIGKRDSKDTYLKLTLDNNKIIEYDILNKDDQITLIKK